jgi:magnesium transporter
MNETIKVLTIISTIFMPLTFIAGVYGMNFDVGTGPFAMPELRARYGYPLTLALMATVAVGQILFFRSRGWIGRSRRRDSRTSNGDVG